MQPTLEQAMRLLFEGSFGEEAPPPRVAGRVGTPESLNEARQIMQRAQDALEAGNLAEFGSAFNELREVLNEPDTVSSPQGQPETPPAGAPAEQDQVPAEQVSQPVQQEPTTSP